MATVIQPQVIQPDRSMAIAAMQRNASITGDLIRSAPGLLDALSSIAPRLQDMKDKNDNQKIEGYNNFINQIAKDHYNGDIGLAIAGDPEAMKAWTNIQNRKITGSFTPDSDHTIEDFVAPLLGIGPIANPGNVTTVDALKAITGKSFADIDNTLASADMSGTEFGTDRATAAAAQGIMTPAEHAGDRALLEAWNQDLIRRYGNRGLTPGELEGERIRFMAMQDPKKMLQIANVNRARGLELTSVDSLIAQEAKKSPDFVAFANSQGIDPEEVAALSDADVLALLYKGHNAEAAAAPTNTAAQQAPGQPQAQPTAPAEITNAVQSRSTAAVGGAMTRAQAEMAQAGTAAANMTQQSQANVDKYGNVVRTVSQAVPGLNANVDANVTPVVQSAAPGFIPPNTTYPLGAVTRDGKVVPRTEADLRKAYANVPAAYMATLEPNSSGKMQQSTITKVFNSPLMAESAALANQKPADVDALYKDITDSGMMMRDINALGTNPTQEQKLQVIAGVRGIRSALAHTMTVTGKYGEKLDTIYAPNTVAAAAIAANKPQESPAAKQPPATEPQQARRYDFSKWIDMSKATDTASGASPEEMLSAVNARDDAQAAVTSANIAIEKIKADLEFAPPAERAALYTQLEAANKQLSSAEANAKKVNSDTSTALNNMHKVGAQILQINKNKPFIIPGTTQRTTMKQYMEQYGVSPAEIEKTYNVINGRNVNWAEVLADPNLMSDPNIAAKYTGIAKANEITNAAFKDIAQIQGQVFAATGRTIRDGAVLAAGAAYKNARLAQEQLAMQQRAMQAQQRIDLAASRAAGGAGGGNNLAVVDKIFDNMARANGVATGTLENATKMLNTIIGQQLGTKAADPVAVKDWMVKHENDPEVAQLLSQIKGANKMLDTTLNGVGQMAEFFLMMNNGILGNGATQTNAGAPIGTTSTAPQAAPPKLSSAADAYINRNLGRTATQPQPTAQPTASRNITAQPSTQLGTMPADAMNVGLTPNFFAK